MIIDAVDAIPHARRQVQKSHRGIDDDFKCQRFPIARGIPDPGGEPLGADILDGIFPYQRIGDGGREALIFAPERQAVAVLFDDADLYRVALVGKAQ
ncbi:MAG: hypothetical protein BWY83_02924 [bacterium ADurb.Bin478]|nr:MAG: hypothetical protein BWY83_02924 [bacterium ADurb.Bin478]